MLSAGKNIKQKNDNLTKIDIQRLFSVVKNPKPMVKDLIDQLRILNQIDPASYKNLKTNLPYVVPSVFNPPFRRIENFGSSEHLILDFDHLNEYNTDAEELKNRLKKDNRIELMFVSPSQNGLKVFFRLKEKFFDAAKYSLFYKNFSLAFARENDINNILDAVTSDVTRACFLSYDENAYLNKDVILLETNNYIDFEDIFEIKDAHKTLKETNIETTKIEKKTIIDKDIFDDIKKRLNPKLKEKYERTKNTYVPQKLDDIIGEVQKHIESYDIEIKEIKNINYGKKIIVEYKLNIAEINVFYGKKGFSIVRSPKTGTNSELMELLYKIVVEFFELFRKI